jgi:hypothetical protein
MAKKTTPKQKIRSKTTTILGPQRRREAHHHLTRPPSQVIESEVFETAFNDHTHSSNRPDDVTPLPPPPSPAALTVVHRRPGPSQALLAGVASGRRRRDVGVVRARFRFFGSLPVLGFFPVGAGSPDQSGEI